jgi:hypothetical protein
MYEMQKMMFKFKLNETPKTSKYKAVKTWESNPHANKFLSASTGKNKHRPSSDEIASELKLLKIYLGEDVVNELKDAYVGIRNNKPNTKIELKDEYTVQTSIEDIVTNNLKNLTLNQFPETESGSGPETELDTKQEAEPEVEFDIKQDTQLDSQIYTDYEEDEDDYYDEDEDDYYDEEALQEVDIPYFMIDEYGVDDVEDLSEYHYVVDKYVWITKKKLCIIAERRNESLKIIPKDNFVALDHYITAKKRFIIKKYTTTDKNIVKCLDYNENILQIENEYSMQIALENEYYARIALEKKDPYILKHRDSDSSLDSREAQDMVYW